MPVYEYRCSSCGRIFEVLQNSDDNKARVCPHCSGRAERIVSHCTFHLKGTGWYATDYAKKSSPDDAYKKDKNKNGDNKDSN